MTILNHIEGTFRLLSPLHVAGGSGSAEKDTATTTYTMKQPIIGKNGTSMVPYFPSNDLRGRLRRKAAAILLDNLVTQDKRCTVELLSGLTCGTWAVSGENDSSVEEILRARDNVYMGVFGGGTRMLRSGIQVHDCLPVTEDIVEAGFVPDNLGVELPTTRGLDRDTPLALRSWQLTHRFKTIRVDDVFRVIDLTMMENALTDAKKEITDYQQKDLERRALRKEDRAAAQVGLANIMETEAIIPGTFMHVRIDMADHLSPAQIGLVLLSLRDLCNEQALGGHIRRGFGRFEANLHGMILGNNVDETGKPLPLISFNKETGQHDLVNAAVELGSEALQAISTLTLDDMWEFFKFVNEPKPKKQAA